MITPMTPTQWAQIEELLVEEIIPKGRKSLVFFKQQSMAFAVDREGIHATDTLTRDYYYEPLVPAYYDFSWGTARITMYLTARMCGLVQQINAIPGTTSHPIPPDPHEYTFKDMDSLFGGPWSGIVNLTGKS